MRRGIVHSVGTRLAVRPVRKIIDIDFRRLALGMPIAAAMPEGTDQFFFLGVRRNHGLAPVLTGHRLIMNELKLHIAVGVIGRPLGHFPRTWQAIPLVP